VKAVIVAFDRFTDVDVFLPWDLLNRVRFRDKDFSVRIVGPSTMHRSVCGLELPMHADLEECNFADLVYFSSGPGTREFIKNDALLKRFRLDPNNQIICSMCSGALILAALGILKGISATTYPTAVEELRGFGIEKMNFMIFNRQGKLVFQSTDQNIGWDGKYKGQLQPMDAYAFVLEVQFADGNRYTKKGDITILR
jgi:gliding motility-associated-like protein